MSLSRWKMMAGVLGVSLGGLAAIAGQCPKTDAHKTARRAADLPVAAEAPPVIPVVPPGGSAPTMKPPAAPPAPALPAPAVDVPPSVPAPVADVLPALPAKSDSLPTLPPLGEPAKKPEAPMKAPAAPVVPAGAEVPALPTPPAVETPKPSAPTTPTPPATRVPEVDPFGKPPAPPAVELPGKPTVPSSPEVTLPGKPTATPPAASDPLVPPTVGTPSVPPARVGGGSDPVIDTPKPEVKTPPVVTSAAAPAQPKFRIILRVGEGEPTFEVKYADDLVMKVVCEKVDIKSPEKGQGLSAVKASGKVRFVGFGAEGTCDELSFLAGTGEVGMVGNVKIQVKDKLGRVESELTTETMKYKIDPAAVANPLKP